MCISSLVSTGSLAVLYLSSSCVGYSWVIPTSQRRRGATAVLVRHKPQSHHHDRSGSVIDRRSTAENCQNHEHIQNFRSATAGWANPQWDHRGTAMTAVAPYKDRSSTSITAAVQPPCNRVKVDWRPYGNRDPVAVLLRKHV